MDINDKMYPPGMVRYTKDLLLSMKLKITFTYFLHSRTVLQNYNFYTDFPTKFQKKKEILRQNKI